MTADCDADADVYYNHHFGATPSDAVRLIVAAGTDIDCGGFMTDQAPGAIADGNVTEGQLDVLLRRLFRVRLRLGHFDKPGALQTIPISDICSPYAVEVARDGARQGTVLLKNDGGLLPLLGTYRSVVVIGPLMDQRDNTYCASSVRLMGNARPLALRSWSRETNPATPLANSDPSKRPCHTAPHPLRNPPTKITAVRPASTPSRTHSTQSSSTWQAPLWACTVCRA